MNANYVSVIHEDHCQKCANINDVEACLSGLGKNCMYHENWICKHLRAENARLSTSLTESDACLDMVREKLEKLSVDMTNTPPMAYGEAILSVAGKLRRERDKAISEIAKYASKCGYLEAENERLREALRCAIVCYEQGEPLFDWITALAGAGEEEGK